MVKIISRFFAFCGEENRKRFHQSILLGVLQAIFEALKIPAIACMVRALLRGSVTTQDILLTLGIMLFSIVSSSLVKARSGIFQREVAGSDHFGHHKCDAEPGKCRDARDHDGLRRPAHDFSDHRDAAVF